MNEWKVIFNMESYYYYYYYYLFWSLTLLRGNFQHLDGFVCLYALNYCYNQASYKLCVCKDLSFTQVPASESHRQACWWVSKWRSHSTEGWWWSPHKWYSVWCQGKGQLYSGPSIRTHHLDERERKIGGGERGSHKLMQCITWKFVMFWPVNRNTVSEDKGGH